MTPPTPMTPPAQPTPPAPVSVVTVTYSPGDTLAAFLDSVRLADGSTVPVVVADNGSTDGSVERAVIRPGLQLVRTGGNLGFGQAANRGVAATATEWVLIANPDVILREDTLDALLAATSRWPRAGALGPLIRTGDGAIYPSARALPSLGRGVGHALFGWFWPTNPWTSAYRREKDAVTERTAGWLSGSCVLVRRVAFDAVGGFDPKFFMYFEDVDLGERLDRAGWLNVYVPSAEIVHLGGHSTSRHRSAMLAEHHHSAMTYLAGRYPGLRHAPLRLALRLGLGARARLLERLSRRPAPGVGGAPAGGSVIETSTRHDDPVDRGPSETGRST
ncbi:glycosyltransferase family 2 protein [Jatrophihabitans telluris]|uniref:Glycosyltransferase family 2 protein n=1 Tax=Jatrophihabitans telluris TaxID=2038343 RepID=A0ABY4QX79_9ACTN|nr:glycosyltransferase family 2 protein [Jatrophihabitans telluris]UQX87549.1 glycosyltransferase family 2 protein [Jatrophihabitans telluris]